MHTSEEAREWLAHALAPDELAHYGVLGMKWGISKDKLSSGRTRSSASPSPKAKAAVKKVATAKKTNTPAKKPVKVSASKDTKLEKGDKIVLGAWGVGAVGYAGLSYGPQVVGVLGAPLYASTITKDLEKISKYTAAIDHGKDFLNSEVNTDVPLGTVFHRVASYKEIDVNGPKYATYLQDDVLRYRQTWITPGRFSFAKHYVTKMEALKGVTIASPDSILKTLETHLDDVLDDGESLLFKYTKVFDKQAYNTIKLADWDHNARGISQLIVTHNRSEIWADDVGKATSEIMQKAGYAAVTDINNTGFGSRKHAVIVLNKAAFKVTSSRLSQAQRAAAGVARRRIAKLALKAAVSKI